RVRGAVLAPGAPPRWGSGGRAGAASCRRRASSSSSRDPAAPGGRSNDPIRAPAGNRLRGGFARWGRRCAGGGGGGRTKGSDPRLDGESIAEVFRSVGGQIRESWCGPCFGQGPDALRPGQRAITSFNRNWQNRMGFGGEGYLA